MVWVVRVPAAGREMNESPPGFRLAFLVIPVSFPHNPVIVRVRISGQIRITVYELSQNRISEHEINQV